MTDLFELFAFLCRRRPALFAVTLAWITFLAFAAWLSIRRL